MSDDLVDRMAKAMAAKCRRSHDWPFWIEEAQAALSAIREAGYVVVPHDISNEVCDRALSVTSSWLDIKGSALTVNREKMRRRWRRALIEYKHLMDKMIGDSVTEALPEKTNALESNG